MPVHLPAHSRRQFLIQNWFPDQTWIVLFVVLVTGFGIAAVGDETRGPIVNDNFDEIPLGQSILTLAEWKGIEGSRGIACFVLRNHIGACPVRIWLLMCISPHR